MKNTFKRLLQKVLGMQFYLFVFSIFVIIKLRWDKNEKDFLAFLKLISNDGILLDIGANIGVMTYFFARKKKNAEVFSFEPVAFNFRNLKRIITLFLLRNVKIYKLALGNENKTIEMVIPNERNVTMHGLCHVKGAGESDAGEKSMAKMVRLDDFSDVKVSGKK